jgi:hypothetical protein
MTEPLQLPASIQEEVLAEARRDYIGVWWIVRKISRKLPQLSAEERRESAIRLIDAMRSSGQLIAGVPTKDGRGFERSGGSPSEITSQIAAAWKPGGPDPDIGDLIWLTAPM